MDFASVKFLKPSKFIAQPFVFNDHILILVEEVIDFEFEFGDGNLFSTELILELDELVLELDPEFPLIVEIVLKLLFCLFELLPFIFEHKFYFPKVMVIVIGPLI